LLACFQNETNKKAVEEDLNPELLACFLRDKMSCVEQATKFLEELGEVISQKIEITASTHCASPK
jgi:hypothetical protein